MSDPEVLTKDKQRIGIAVAGTVRRPGLDKANILLSHWANYSTFYLSDTALIGTPGTERNPGSAGLMVFLGQQASKVQKAVTEENARASLAAELARAAMFEGNPRYTDLQRVQAMAAAYKQTDKFLLLPAGTDPYVFIGGENVPVTVPAPRR